MSKKTKKEKIQSANRRKEIRVVKKQNEDRQETKNEISANMFTFRKPNTTLSKTAELTTDEKLILSATKKDILFTVILTIIAITALLVLSFFL